MITKLKLCLFTLTVFIQLSLSADFSQINDPPIHLLMNKNPKASLVNSVDFHPKTNRFCVTFTQNNSIVIYQLDETDQVEVFQVLKKAHSKLSCPQHALFSQDGMSLVVANWYNQTFNVYLADGLTFLIRLECHKVGADKSVCKLANLFI